MHTRLPINGNSAPRYSSPSPTHHTAPPPDRRTQTARPNLRRRPNDSCAPSARFLSAPTQSARSGTVITPQRQQRDARRPSQTHTTHACIITCHSRRSIGRLPCAAQRDSAKSGTRVGRHPPHGSVASAQKPEGVILEPGNLESSVEGSGIRRTCHTRHTHVRAPRSSPGADRATPSPGDWGGGRWRNLAALADWLMRRGGAISSGADPLLAPLLHLAAPPSWTPPG